MKKAQVSRRPGKAKSSSTHRLGLKVFVAYADLPAFRHATAAIGEGIRNSGRPVELEPMLWQIQQLVSPHWRERTIHAALEADVVVLTTSTAEDVTHTLERWISEFLESARGRKTTLVVISGPRDAWTISIERPLHRSNEAHLPLAAMPAQKLVA